MKQQVEDDIVIKYKVPRSRRILAFDLMRGFFLLVIMIDHIELYPSGLDLFTGKGRLWASAAEGFFFMSGLLIGMMYKRRLHFGMRFIFKKMWLRAAELYIVGVGLTFLFLAWAIFTHHTNVKDSLPVPFDWAHYSWQALTMRFTYGWADFLVRFAILMFFAPFVFYLVAKRRWWLALAGIVTVWLFRGQNFTMSWQLIFNSAIVVGFYWPKIEEWFRTLKKPQRSKIKRVMAGTELVTFAASYMSVFPLTLLNMAWGWGRLPGWLQHVTFTWNRLNYDIWVYADKWTMGPLRVALFFLWFTVFYWLVHKYETKVGQYTGGLLELLGRNSLFVYTAHAFIVFIFKLYLIPPNTSFLENLLITAAGLAILILITYSYKKLQPRLARPA